MIIIDKNIDKNVDKWIIDRLEEQKFDISMIRLAVMMDKNTELRDQLFVSNI